MPVYLPEPQETLADRLGREPLIVAEAGLVLAQIFEGLRFLHEHGIVHGSLYPGSIRIKQSSPWLIQLSDVCLHPYVELENREERRLYASLTNTGITKPVPQWDIWSAGVVGLVLLSPDGLPTRPKSRTSRRWSITLANRAIHFRNAEKPGPKGKKEAARFLTNVLKVELNERLAAEECLQDPWLALFRPPPANNDHEEPPIPPIPNTPPSDEDLEYGRIKEEEEEEEEGGGEDTETEEPHSSRSKGKQPVHPRRPSRTLSGNQSRQPSRTPISKGKQPLHSRRSSAESSSYHVRQRSVTHQSLPTSPRSPIGSRHAAVGRSIRIEDDDDIKGFRGSGSSK